MGTADDVKDLERRVKSLEGNVKDLLDRVKKLEKQVIGDQFVYIQNMLPGDDRGYNIQNDNAGGTTFAHANVPEPGQKLRIIKWPTA